MLKIYICEDIDVQRENLKKTVENVIIMEELDMELACVSDNPEEILDKVRNTKEVGIYFLDIDLKTDMNGMNLALKIREFDPRGFIIFVTTHSEMSYMTFIYKIEAMDFILKDDSDALQKRIRECILEAKRRFASTNNNLQNNFSVKVREKVYTVDYDDILFFETSSNVHKVILHCKNRQMEFAGKIKDIEDQLDDRFYRCHRSFLVNKDNIEKIDFKNRMIYMVNGDECMISSRMMKGLK
ncbi:MAG: response regulator transcription factor [Eubacterium sp.]|nr:response regulator transcription factor [Eubacterium sp.]